jgi:hypothetical protein
MKGRKGMDRKVLAECAIKGIEVSKLEMRPPRQRAEGYE